MIKTVEGNILDAEEDIICHQVNCKGVMGAGLAKQIKSKYPNVYKDYKRLCAEQGDDLLSSVQISSQQTTEKPLPTYSLKLDTEEKQNKQMTTHYAAALNI